MRLENIADMNVIKYNSTACISNKKFRNTTETK